MGGTIALGVKIHAARKYRFCCMQPRKPPCMRDAVSSRPPLGSGSFAANGVRRVFFAR